MCQSGRRISRLAYCCRSCPLQALCLHFCKWWHRTGDSRHNSSAVYIVYDDFKMKNCMTTSTSYVCTQKKPLTHPIIVFTTSIRHGLSTFSCSSVSLSLLDNAPIYLATTYSISRSFSLTSTCCMPIVAAVCGVEIMYSAIHSCCHHWNRTNFIHLSQIPCMTNLDTFRNIGR